MEDWIALLEGYREYYQPVGAPEDTFVYDMALNRWQRFRLDRWRWDTIENQVALADFESRDGLDLAYASLPEDEARWFGFDAAKALDALDALTRSGDASKLTPDSIAGVLFALQCTCRAGGSDRHVNESSPVANLMSMPCTAKQLVGRIEQVAQLSDLPREEILAAAREEAEAAAELQTLRAQQNRHRRAFRMASAYVLPDRAADKDMRYAAQLDRQYDRLLKQLETAQAARRGLLSPRIRLEVDNS